VDLADVAATLVAGFLLGSETSAEISNFRLRRLKPLKKRQQTAKSAFADFNV
jgi:hypothetical protein